MVEMPGGTHPGAIEASCPAVFRSISDWNIAVNGSAWEVEIDTPPDATFGGHFSRTPAGPVDINVGWVSRQDIRRSRKAIRRDRVEYYGIILLRSGVANISHCGSDVSVSSGDIVTIDSSEPYEAAFNETETVCLRMSKAWLERHVRAPESWRGRVIRREEPTARLLAPKLLELADGLVATSNIPDIAGRVGAILQESLFPAEEGQSPYCRSTFLRLRQKLDRMADNHEFEVARFAQACNMSERSIHAMFAKFGTTVWTELQSARLERSRRTVLNEVVSTRRSVNELAYESGFTNASHFARRFRRRFGVAPHVALRKPELLEL